MKFMRLCQYIENRYPKADNKYKLKMLNILIQSEDKKFLEDYRSYVINCLEDENFDLETMENYYTWKEVEIERLKEEGDKN